VADDMAAADRSGPEFDTTVSHSARIWNYWLGGKDNYAADRQAGDKVAAMLPSIVAQARASRAQTVSNQGASATAGQGATLRRREGWRRILQT
jgi:hypothetical protein